MRLFVHAFRFESRWLRLGRFGQPIELNRDQIAWIELRSESPRYIFAPGPWNQETLARTTQRFGFDSADESGRDRIFVETRCIYWQTWLPGSPA